MEYQEGGSLGDCLERQQKFTEDECKLMMAQLLLTIDFMTRKGIVHRDLKPENILLNSKAPGVFDIRIADFGFAEFLSSEDATFIKMVCGTPGYIAPEAIIGKGYNFKSDIFSAGSILYSIFSLKNLF